MRKRIGISGVVVGLGLLLVGSLSAHFTGLPETNSLGQEIYPHVPRCAWFEPVLTDGACWVIPTSMQLLAVIGSQLLFAGIVLGWIIGKPLTWARATAGALIFTVEMLIIFGIVPNQFLALTQGTFEWTGQKIAFTLPTWLMLNNEVQISYGVIKDIIAGGYAATMLGVVAVTAYQLQERAKKREARDAGLTPAEVSTFGRPLVKGER
jgi:hypothetical protein